MNPVKSSIDLFSRYKALADTLESSSQPFNAGYSDGKMVICNQAFCDLVGYTLEELKQISWNDLTPPEYLELEKSLEVKIHTTSREQRFEKEYIRKDGSRVPVEILVHAVYDQERQDYLSYVFVTDITSRKFEEKHKNALYQISEAAHTAHNLNDLFQLIYTYIKDLLPAPNFYIALYDAAEKVISYPLFIDEKDTPPTRRPINKGLTDSVIRGGKALLLDPEKIQAGVREGRFIQSGAPSVYWLGVPLISAGRIIGVLAVHSYSESIPIVEKDQKIMEFVSDQVAMAIERKRAEENLRENEERYALAVRGSNEGIWDWDLRTNHIYYSPRWKEILGFREDEIGSTPQEWFERIHPQDREKVLAELKAHLQGDTPNFQCEYRMQHSDGSHRWVLVRGLCVREDGLEPHRVAGSLSDITNRKVIEDRLVHDAMHDPLTGLPNRAYFIDQLRRSLERVRRTPKSRSGVIFLDLDRFKNINDSLGHSSGDLFLIQVSHKLEECLRPSDVVARFGGDEFAVLLENVEDPKDAFQICERIQQQLNIPFVLQNHEVYTTASIGIALTDQFTTRAEDLVRDADTAMYRAKAGGKNRYEIFNAEMHAHSLALLQLETDLRWALERQEFTLYYQPVITLSTGKMTSVEALVRWRHPRRGIVFPGEFIPLTEETGLIVPLSDWVLKTACAQVKSWRDAGFTEPQVAVNISARLLQDRSLPQQVKNVLNDTQLDPSALRLEITESAAMREVEIITQVLQEVNNLGVQISIDDFGTSYSSLDYLKRFPVDTIKIDRTFIRHVSYDVNDAAISTAIITMAHILGLKVVAEGVETEDQLEFLRSQHCDEVQGYLLGRPQPPEVITSMLLGKRLFLH